MTISNLGVDVGKLSHISLEGMLSGIATLENNVAVSLKTKPTFMIYLSNHILSSYPKEIKININIKLSALLLPLALFVLDLHWKQTKCARKDKWWYFCTFIH